MTPFLRTIGTSLTLLLVVICLSVLLVTHRGDSHLGLWDSGRFSSKVMPEPQRITEDQMAKLGLHARISLQPTPDGRQGQTLEELFGWYDLDARYVDATVNANRIDPSHVQNDPFYVVLINDN
jgi:hypothetical protein